MERELTLHIILEKPPAGVDYGLQKGHGNPCETIQKQRSQGKDLEFEFTVAVKAASNANPPDFAGPFVQGKAGGRFVYIDIGSYAGQSDTPWGRRLKVPLTGITRQMTQSHTALEARVPGTGKDGGPNCATVKPF